MRAPSDRLSPELLARIRAAVSEGTTIATLTLGKANRIAEISSDGIRVETDRSDAKGAGPQLVPAALINHDWELLASTGRLTHDIVSRRGSFTCALFAAFDDVEVVSSRPIELRIAR